MAVRTDIQYVQFYVDGSTAHPRYALLRDQFGYHEWDFNYIWNDPLYY